MATMISAATKAQPELDPILRAAARARRGTPLTDDERRAKEEGAAEPATSRPAPAIPENAPAWQAALAAPLDDEPETEIEAQAIKEALRGGQFVEGATVSADQAMMQLPCAFG